MVGIAVLHVLLLILFSAAWPSSRATIISEYDEARAINTTQQLIQTLESETPQRIENVL